jgi:hypothetical protein
MRLHMSGHGPKQQAEGTPSAPGTLTVTYANKIHTPRFRESRRPGSQRSVGDTRKVSAQLKARFGSAEPEDNPIARAARRTWRAYDGVCRL